MSSSPQTDQPRQTKQTDVAARPAISVQRQRTFIAIGVILLAITGIVLAKAFGWSGNNASQAQEDPATASEVRRLPVRVEPVKLVDTIEQKRTYTGTIRAKQRADLGFELTGRIASVLCDEGDVIEQGDILAHLDTKGLLARRAAINASLDQAVAVLNELKAGPREQTIATMRAQLNESNSNLKLAELTLERRRDLRRGNAISKEEYDRALYSFRASRSRVNATQKQLDELEAGTRPEKLTAQDAAVEQLRSSMAEIEVQIEKSSIVAPFAGKIVQRMADPGGIATASVPILKLVDVNNLEAVIGIPAKTTRKLQTAHGYAINVSDQEYSAELIAKIEQLDVATRTQNLIFQLSEQANGQVLPGQLCQIEIATDIETEGFWVPSHALSNGIRGLWSLLVIDDETSRTVRTDVQIVYSDGDRALVSGSVREGTMVVIEGTHRIVEGQHVQPLFDQVSRKP